ncbi:expressed unknown protein [Seminavis robusta]|uniref:Uncharacterized protein n=1 Tax=Seminavis robusta TaxID=568900 RepID=A0A9N8DA53_9STRA|nr:expressed unknown protein [Seminavis robusta]|eukprot:Sro31_g020220.1 n/a (139) ;mRNA; r:65438-65854
MGNTPPLKIASRKMKVEPQALLAAMERYGELTEEDIARAGKMIGEPKKKSKRKNRRMKDASSSTSSSSSEISCASTGTERMSQQSAVSDMSPQMILRMLEQGNDAENFFAAVRATRHIPCNENEDDDCLLPESIGYVQ